KTLPPLYASKTTPAEDWASVTPDADMVLLSSEEFSRAAPDRVNFAELAGFAQNFDELTIVCVLRTPIDFLQSSYLEVIKKRDCAPIGAFVQSVLDPQVTDALHYDPNPLLDQLQAQLPTARLIFLPYARSRKGPGGLVGALFSALGVAFPVADLVLVAKERANVSAPVLAAWMAHQISRPAAAGRGLIDLADRALAPEIGDLVPSLFTQDERTALYDFFAPRIERFDARVQAFDPTYRSDSFPSLGGRFGREGVSPTAWARFARFIYEARERQTMDPRLEAVA
ncbi:MAG: hypothetical protein AAGA78_07320, partial [Pseudomonadota bacterium]